jgi:hypothetical protein
MAIAPELHGSRGNSVLHSSIDLGRSLDLDDLVVFALNSCSRACLCEMRWVHLRIVLCQLLGPIHVQNRVSDVSATFVDYCKASLPSDLPRVSPGRIAAAKRFADTIFMYPKPTESYCAEPVLGLCSKSGLTRLTGLGLRG